jgi:diguanylate cyclase (GGDEF)-like protein
VVLFCAFVLVAYQRNTERQARESRHRAAHDGLTGVANRSLLAEKLDAAVKGGRAGLLLLDLNRFKEVNDTLGHHAGDVLIQDVARRLVASARRYDTVARLGGDEFAIVLPDVTSTDDLLRLGERILTALCLPAEVDGVTVDVSASIGASLFPVQSANAARPRGDRLRERPGLPHVPAPPRGRGVRVDRGGRARGHSWRRILRLRMWSSSRDSTARTVSIGWNPRAR